MFEDIRSRMNLFIVGLGRVSSKESRAAMLIGDMDISRLIVYVLQVEEKVSDREKYMNNKSKD